MTERGLLRADADWRQTVERRREALALIQNELVELEAELADELAAINAFEFKLRARLQPLILRLERLDAEIKELLTNLRREELFDVDEDWSAWSVDEEGAAAAGDYRYRESAPPAPPLELDPAEGAKLKQLYRQLARRFHPDMAVDEADRRYRTQLMIAINAAYAAGDLSKLQALTLEPDAANLMDFADGDEHLAEVLLREIERCQRRIAEVRQELATLAEHESARLMRKVQREAALGRDTLARIEHQLRDEISRKMVERDVLNSELENLSTAEPGLHGDAFADVVWDTSLEQAFDDDPESQFTEWILRRSGGYYSDDDILDDSD
jgi:hypothetical protein